MRKVLNIAVVVSVLLCVGALSAAQTNCELHSIDRVPATSPIAFEDIAVQFTPETSVATVRIRNGSDEAIHGVFFVVDFYRVGQYALSMTFYSATLSGDSKVHPAVPFSPAFMSAWQLSSSILPGVSYKVAAESVIRLSTCPDEAHLALVQAIFSKRGSVDLEVPGWRSDPSPLRVSRDWPLSMLPSTRAAEVVRLTIDEKGRPHVIAISDRSPELSDVLSKQLEDTLVFLPARYEGAPTAVELVLLIRFNPSKSDDDIFSEIPSEWKVTAVMVVDVSRIAGGGYEISMGGIPVLGVLPKR